MFLDFIWLLNSLQIKRMDDWVTKSIEMASLLPNQIKKHCFWRFAWCKSLRTMFPDLIWLLKSLQTKRMDNWVIKSIEMAYFIILSFIIISFAHHSFQLLRSFVLDEEVTSSERCKTDRVSRAVAAPASTREKFSRISQATIQKPKQGKFWDSSAILSGELRKWDWL